MKTAVLYVLLICILLSGCAGIMDGSYEWEASHPIDILPNGDENISAGNFQELCKALQELVEAGAEQGTIYIGDYDRENLQQEAQKAAQRVQLTDPIAAYAVESISCQLGTTGIRSALAVQITYRHDKTEIRKIKHVADNGEAKAAIATALRTCEPGIVLYIADYSSAYFGQIVADYAMEAPQYVMELPQVNENIYPETGQARVVELKFAYQTSRESLKKMQTQVQRVFSSADYYVSSDGSDDEKLSQLYSFLMNRFDYKLDTSITPAYHLLCHGIGDSKAFASAYAAMCRQAGVEAYVVSGTRDGVSWYWNIIRDTDMYYHVDLLRSQETGELLKRTDEEMSGYVWVFGDYPRCEPQTEEIKIEENLE